MSYTYDPLNRLSTKTASGITYGYLYDVSSVGAFTAANPRGRMIEASNNVNASEQFSYDTMGRVRTQTNCIPSNCSVTANAFGAQYDYLGDTTSVTYPDGRVVNQAWDTLGRLQTSTFDNWNGTHVGYTYLTPVYWPDGSLMTAAYGDGSVENIAKNKRFQPTSITLNGSLSTLNSKLLLSKQYCYASGCGAATTNNGNIWQITDGLNANRTQTATYDTLNRIQTFKTTDLTMQQNFSIDPFGNTSVPSGTLTNSLGFGTNNRINSGSACYDAAGNEICSNNGVSTTTYTFDALNQITQVNSGNTATYTYSADGNRVRKDAGGTSTEYLYFGGQPLAEKNSDGTWSDYIFANGQRIARADSYDRRIHIHGTTNSAGAWAAWSLPVAAFVVQSGDKLCFRQYQTGGARGGINIGFSDGTGTGWVAQDLSGQVINSDTIQGTWLFRTVDLTSYAGKTLNSMWVDTDAATPVGSTWDNYFGDIAYVKANGTVQPIYARDQSVSLTYHSSGTIANQTAVIETWQSDYLLPNDTTTYYHGDQIGSSRMMTSSAGWPIWAEDYYPFGQDASSVSSVNHYRFTGKERDTESGIDYFGARYYASSMGRFMSPDWSAKVEPVPYSKLDNPQSLNLYAYVLNQPLTVADPDGHAPMGWGGFENCASNNSSTGECAKSNQDQQAQQPAQQQNNTNGYQTQDNAAKGALAGANPASIKANLEYGGLIYEDKSGKYYYSGPVVGGDQGVNPHDAKAPDGTTVVGDYHTHGDYSTAGPGGKAIRTGDPKRDDFNSDHFSGADKRGIASDGRGQPAYRGYLGTPSGKFLIYNPTTGQEGPLQ